jgi:hypothetical protein
MKNESYSHLAIYLTWWGEISPWQLLHFIRRGAGNTMVYSNRQIGVTHFTISFQVLYRERGSMRSSVGSILSVGGLAESALAASWIVSGESTIKD